MVLSFIGFSGCGKSHVTKQFVADLGWRAFCCDDLIERRLEAELPPRAPHGTRRVAAWLGQPYSAGFEERQARYTAAERSVMTDICAELATIPREENLIVDTTGSVIYSGDETLSALRARSTVVYFQLPPSDEELLFKQYLSDPKPVIWQDKFRIGAGEAPDQALRRCYPELLRERAGMYERLADRTVPAGFSDRGELTPQKLLTLLGES